MASISPTRIVVAALWLCALVWCFIADCRYHDKPDHLAHEAPLGEWLIGPPANLDGSDNQRRNRMQTGAMEP